MKIIISLEVPDGTTFRIEPVEASGEAYVPPFADELIPLPENAIPLPGDPQPYRAAAQNPGPGVCPVHKLAWKVVPAGISNQFSAVT